MLCLLSLRLDLGPNLNNCGGCWQGRLRGVIRALLSRRLQGLRGPALGLMLCCHHPGILLFFYFNKGYCIFILHWAVENYIAVSRSWYRSFSCRDSSWASFLLFYLLFFLWLSCMHFVSCHIAIWWTGREQIHNRHWYFCEDLFPQTPSHMSLFVSKSTTFTVCVVHVGTELCITVYHHVTLQCGHLYFSGYCNLFELLYLQRYPSSWALLLTASKEITVELI